jgi:fatty acid desaturase
MNEWGGRFAAAFFPTGLRVQRAYHLAHHRHNRSPQERFDYLQPGESVWLKRAQWYSILTGLYWAVALAGLLLYLVLPRVLRSPAFRERSSRLATQTGASAYLGMLDDIDPLTGRLEIAFSLGIQGLLVVALDLTLTGWLACYLAFALHWSTLQYADHAFSPLDVREGAWNLRTYALARLFFLNYHFHLAHHRHPSVPWLYLPRLVEPGDAYPRYWRVWLSMWAGPRPLPDGAA